MSAVGRFGDAHESAEATDKLSIGPKRGKLELSIQVKTKKTESVVRYQLGTHRLRALIHYLQSVVDATVDAEEPEECEDNDCTGCAWCDSHGITKEPAP